MFFQVSFLGETFLTIFILTDIGPFFSMYSKVLYEVVPFSENFITVFGFAFQNLHVFHCERIFKLVNTVVLGLGHDFINFDLLHIEVLSFKYFYNSVLGYLFFYVRILNFLSCLFFTNIFLLMAGLGLRNIWRGRKVNEWDLLDCTRDWFCVIVREIRKVLVKLKIPLVLNLV